MRHYEATIVLDPALGEEGITKQLDRTKKMIEERGGKILEENNWGIRTMAYAIAKKDQGFYAVIEFEAPGEMIVDLDAAMRLDENVLRHLVIHMDTKSLNAREEQRRRKAERAERAASGDDDDDDDDEDEDEEDED